MAVVKISFYKLEREGQFSKTPLGPESRIMTGILQITNYCFRNRLSCCGEGCERGGKGVKEGEMNAGNWGKDETGRHTLPPCQVICAVDILNH